MKQEVRPIGAVQGVDHLLVVAGAERGHHQRLGLAAGEQARPVGARQHADLGDDRAHRHEIAAVDAAAVVEDVPAHHVGLELLDDELEVLALPLLLGQAGEDRLLGRADRGLAVELVADAEGGAHRLAAGRLGAVVERGVVGRGEGERLAGGVLGHVDDQVDHRLHLLVAELHRAEHLGLGELVGLGLDHHHRVLGAGDDQVEPLLGVAPQLLHVVDCRVEHVAAVDEPDARRADRAEERRARQGSAARGGDHADDVGIVLHVVAEHGDDDLGLVLEALDEQRPDRPVDQAGGQHLLLGRPRLALEEAARNLAGGVGLFLVVNGQREEVEAGLRLLLVDDGGQHAGLAVGGDDGGVGLPGDLPRFEGERVMAPLDRFLDDVEHCLFLRIGGGPPGPGPCNADDHPRTPLLRDWVLPRGRRGPADIGGYSERSGAPHGRT